MVSEDIAVWYEEQADFEGQPKAVLLRNALRKYKDMISRASDISLYKHDGENGSIKRISEDDELKLKFLSSRSISYKDLVKIIDLYETLSEHFSTEKVNNSNHLAG